MFGRYKKMHMIGIGGIGMSGIARVLLNQGYDVTGSDLKDSDTISELVGLGAEITNGHFAENVMGADLVIVSSAIDEKNPEIAAAKKHKIPVIPRAEMLNELMRLKHGIAVGGSHGKTSTTAMIAWVLERAGFDPTAIIGGRVTSFNSNAKIGSGEFLVAEADESDGSFLKLFPSISVITNIDREHLDKYGEFENLKSAFVEFANKVPFYGSSILCADDPVIRDMLPRFSREIITYGRELGDYRFSKFEQRSGVSSFEVTYRGDSLGSITLPMIGEHYAYNALAAIAVAREIGIDFVVAADALQNFMGVARRFQILYRGGPVIVDDYAHHPSEIDATLKAAKLGWPTGEIVAVVQPHRFTRLASNFEGFVTSLGMADAIYVTKVYAAGEDIRSDFDGRSLANRLKHLYPEKPVNYCDGKDELLMEIAAGIKKEDILIFMGAGSITNFARDFAKGFIS